MEYLIGLILSLAVVGFAAAIGLDRERAFYPTLLIVIASYYVLFAAMGGSRHTLTIEMAVAGSFLLVAVLGCRGNFWLVVAALIGHGVFDFVHHFLIDNPGVPDWWPGFCLAFDALLGGFLAGKRCWSVTFGWLGASVITPNERPSIPHAGDCSWGVDACFDQLFVAPFASEVGHWIRSRF
jgi:hypothetical protein